MGSFKNLIRVLVLFFGVLAFVMPAFSQIVVMDTGYRDILLAENLSDPQDILTFIPGGGYGDNLFVSEYGANRISKITPAGGVLPLSTHVQYAVAVLFGSGGFGHFLYASESYSNDGTVVKITPTGAKTTFVSGIAGPLDMVWGNGGGFGTDLYVTAANDDLIYRVTPAGAKTVFAQNLARPSVLAFGQGGGFGTDLYFTNSEGGQVLKVDASGNVQTFASGLDYPIGLDFGVHTAFGDYMYVSEKNTGKIKRIAPDGTKTDFATGFDSPVEIHFSQGGRYANDMLIADGGAGKIYRIKNMEAFEVAIGPPPADVGTAPFIFSVTLSSTLGVANAASLSILYNGADVTQALVPLLAQNIPIYETNRLRAQIANVVLPAGTHTLEVQVTDFQGRQSFARTTYTVSP